MRGGMLLLLYPRREPLITVAVRDLVLGRFDSENNGRMTASYEQVTGLDVIIILTLCVHTGFQSQWDATGADHSGSLTVVQPAAMERRAISTV